MGAHSNLNFFLTIILIFLIFQTFHMDLREWNDLTIWGESMPISRVKMIPGSKWIVLTSIQLPTEDVKRLATQKDWNIVVVADEKTPSNWTLKNVHFLSVKNQTSMGDLAAALPFNSYTRKNLGYIYAIKKGAEWIYDTDDDNKPYGMGLLQFDYDKVIYGMRYVSRSSKISEKLFNPYRFFGFKDMWPRGFPLEYLKDHSNGKNRTLACRKMKTAAVQQGLVHHDPDVDAIFRLQNADRKTGLNVEFNNIAPPIILEQGTYSPWNSQNTLFHRRAFFTMFLPTTVAFRVTDIWRSYFAQKLLHLIGEEIAFYPVNAVQYRNAHNYLKDFNEEIDVYSKSGKIVEFLDSWSCKSNKTTNCIMELADEFVNRKFFESKDRDLMKLWIKALENIGYDFPVLQKYSSKLNETTINFGDCRFSNLDIGIQTYTGNTTKNYDWATKALNGFGELLTWCNQRNQTIINNLLPSPKRFLKIYKNNSNVFSKRNTVLVFMNNFPWKFSMGLFQRLYSPFFKAIIFCGTWNEKDFISEPLAPIEPMNFVNITTIEMEKGRHYHYCVPKIRDLRLQGVEGYFFVADDTVFNIWKKVNISSVMHPIPKPNNSSNWWNNQAGQRAYDLLIKKYKDDILIQNSWNEFSQKVKTDYLRNKTADLKKYVSTFSGKLISDFFYVPASQMLLFSGMLEVFAEGRIFCEVAMGKFFNVVKYEVGEGRFNYLWYGGERNKLGENYNKSLLGLHPWKTSGLNKDLKQRELFCSLVVKGFAEEIYWK